MATLHPKFAQRRRRRLNLKRPTLEHPVLGRLEYINRDGGWWQSTAEFSGENVRLDVQEESSNLPACGLEPFASALENLRERETLIRTQVAEELANAGLRRSPRHEAEHKLVSPHEFSLAKPFMIVLYRDRSEIRYDCVDFPINHWMRTFFVTAYVTCDFALERVLGDAKDLHYRCEVLFDQPVPAELPSFHDSLPDQVIATVVDWGTSWIDAPALELLSLASEKVKVLRASNNSCNTYLRRVQALLHDLATEAGGTLNSERS